MKNELATRYYSMMHSLETVKSFLVGAIVMVENIADEDDINLYKNNIEVVLRETFGLVCDCLEE